MHVVYTHFVNMGSQELACAGSSRCEVVDGGHRAERVWRCPVPLYEFEPESGGVSSTRSFPGTSSTMVYLALLTSAASEHAARRRR